MSGKSHWCPFCHHDPPDGDLQSLQQLEPLLPPDYDHSVCSLEADGAGGLKVSLKLKALEEQEVQKWLQDFQNSSKTTWRVSRTYPGAKQRNKYRVDLRCQHGGYGLYKATKKNTFCPAMLYLTLKQDIFREKGKCRSSDPHLHNQLNLYILLRHTHNHQLHAPESLRHRDVSKETIEKLESLFQHGHSPSSALKALKNQLRAQTGEGFEEAVMDHALCPDLAFCYRRFYKMFPERKGKRRGRKKGGAPKREAIFIDQNGAASTDETFEALAALQQTPLQVCVPEGSVYTVVQMSDTELRLRSMFQDLLDKSRTEAELEEPLRTMLCAYETMSSDSDKLAFALKTFGRMKRGNTRRATPKPNKRAKLAAAPPPEQTPTAWAGPVQASYISYTVTPTTPTCTFKITQ